MRDKTVLHLTAGEFRNASRMPAKAVVLCIVAFSLIYLASSENDDEGPGSEGPGSEEPDISSTTLEPEPEPESTVWREVVFPTDRNEMEFSPFKYFNPKKTSHLICKIPFELNPEVVEEYNPDFRRCTDETYAFRKHFLPNSRAVPFDYETKLMKNEDLLEGPCMTAFKDFLPFPPPDKHFSCNNPFRALEDIGYEANVFLYGVYRDRSLDQFGSELTDHPQVKQRRTRFNSTPHAAPLECLIETDQPLHCFDCMSKAKVTLEDDPEFFDTRWEYNDTIIPFAEAEEYCFPENEAYLHGAVLSTVELSKPLPVNKTREALGVGYPWGRLHKFWPRLVNLHLAGLDNVDNTSKPACSSEPFETVRLGDCIFNQRLAVDYWHTKDVNVTRNTCQVRKPRGCFKNDTIVTKNAVLVNRTVELPVVGLGCSPYKMFYCHQEYTTEQMLESRCRCHPMYTNTTRKSQPDRPEKTCYAMAGVPCKFEKDANHPNDKTLVNNVLEDIDCANGTFCRSLTDVVGNSSSKKLAEDKWEFFEESFSGFGMPPIARDYLVLRATHFCDCEDPQKIRTVFNECVDQGRGVELLPNLVLIVVAFIGVTWTDLVH